MNLEDYFKYYIQGSDHYLIPKDIFIELFDEMENWREEVKELKEKYLNAVADYETTMFEKEQLNSLVNSCQEEIRQLKKQLEEWNHHLKCAKEMLDLQGQSGNYNYDSYMLGLYNGMEYIISLFETREPIYKEGKDIEFLRDKNQQKEFIDYMNKTIEELECDDVDDEEMKGYLIQRIDTFKEILSKYKEIIGISNENNMGK